MAEKMYISTGGPIIIGDTITGNQHSGERYFLYTKREAERAYRENHGLQGKHFQKIMVDPTWFGYYLDGKQETSEDWPTETIIATVTDVYQGTGTLSTTRIIKFEPETEIKLEVCDEKNVASLFWVNDIDADKLIGKRCEIIVRRNMAWHLDVTSIITL